MTGYGQAATDAGGVRLTVEVRSVNHRFAEVRVRLPDALAGLEREHRATVLGRVRRGRVDVSVNVERGGGSAVTWALNEPLLCAVVAAADRVRETLGSSERMDLATVLAVPGMFSASAPDTAWAEAAKPALATALGAALAALDADRQREGAALRDDLVGRATAMDQLVEQLHESAREVPATVRERLVERLRALAADVSLDPARVAQEAVLLADRCDVTEELVRLRGHLAQLRALLDGADDEPVGRRIEFLVQEMQRETNTLGSKAPQLELTRAALAVKSELEKVREQVLNLE